jgi:hypothetical protein
MPPDVDVRIILGADLEPKENETAKGAKAPAPEAVTPAAPEPEPVKAKAPEPTPPRLDVLNGMGKKGFAQEMRRLLVKKGYQVVAIGDFKDSEMETTEIRYRAKHKQVAQTLKAKVFPTALVKPSQDIPPDVDVRIILGADLAPEESEAAKEAKTPAPAPKPEERAAPPAKVAAQPEVKAPAAPVPSEPKAEPGKAPQKPPLTPPTPAKPPAPPPAPEKSGSGVLSAAELMGTAIDLRNGNGAQGLCQQVRARLSREGFQVASIGNHVDFGQEITAIYYRPGKEKVAQALKGKFFPGARLESGPNLSPGVDIKVILGHDLKSR